jgi:hypothetical protein
MKNSRLALLMITLLALVVNGFAFDTAGHARASSQDAEKSLEIERHANEPFKLVEFKVGEQPIEDKIAIKYRRNDVGLDTVTFKELDGWFKRVSIKLRNVSGKQIYGVRAFLYFRPSHTRMLYSLPLMASSQLGHCVVEPNSEITLAVTDQAWTLTTNILKQHGVDPDLASVRFSLETVWFSNELQWRRGLLLHRDPDNPNRWIPFDKTGE